MYGALIAGAGRLVAAVELYDISIEVRRGMLAWPTGRPAAVHRVVDQGTAAEPRNSEWTLDSHAGTHVDAPLHFLPAAGDVETIPLQACLGRCQILEVEGQEIDASSLRADSLQSGARLLFKTENSRRRISRVEFDPEFAAISVEAAQRIAAAGVALVGVDYLSVESSRGTGDVHRILLEAGVVLLESLDLSAVEPGGYNLCALPLRLSGGEASPVRAVLWR